MSQKSKLRDDTPASPAEQDQHHEVQRLLGLLSLSSPTQVDALGRIKFGDCSYTYPASLGVKITNKAQG